MDETGRPQLIRSLVELQLATDAVDAAAAELLDVNRTDLRLLSVLDAHGDLSAGELAGHLSLTPASTTVAVQRLQAAGYVERSQDVADRRRAVITLTARARRRIKQAYAPLAEDGARELSALSSRDVAVIDRFLRMSAELQRRHADRIRATASRSARNAPSRAKGR